VSSYYYIRQVIQTSALQTLKLYNNYITSVTNEIGKMTALTELSLSYNQVCGLKLLVYAALSYRVRGLKLLGK
jgi:Leucine-rich repeat (LRR) protein